MAKGDTFFLRTNLTSSGTTYVSDDIDISAYTDPARGRVLVVDKGFITFSTDSNGPVKPGDIDSVIGDRSMGAQVCSEKQTSLVAMNNNSLFMKSNLYSSNTVNDAGGQDLLYQQMLFTVVLTQLSLGQLSLTLVLCLKSTQKNYLYKEYKNYW